MNRYLFCLILVLIATDSAGQSPKFIDIPIYRNSYGGKDTSLWFKDYSNLAYQLKLPDLQLSSDSFHFRFWTDKQAIDIWTTNGITVFGNITNFAQRFNKKLLKKGKYEIDKILSNTILLNATSAKYIYDFITTFQLGKIPTDEKIKGWGQGFDGVEYLLEFSDTQNYSFKQYWSPLVFSDSLIEAKKIQQFANYLFTDLNLWNYYKKLKLPTADYKANGVHELELNFPILNNFYKISIYDWFL